MNGDFVFAVEGWVLIVIDLARVIEIRAIRGFEGMMVMLPSESITLLRALRATARKNVSRKKWGGFGASKPPTKDYYERERSGSKTVAHGDRNGRDE